MVLLFALLTAVFGLPWYGKRRFAIITFYVFLALATFWFMHHATDTLAINL